jgi:hypothetical protein
MNVNNDKDKAFRIQNLFEVRKNMIYDMSIGLQDNSQFLDSYSVASDSLHNIRKKFIAEYARHVYSDKILKQKLRLKERGSGLYGINLIHILMILHGIAVYSKEEEEGDEGDEDENDIINNIKFKELDKKLELDKIDNQWAYCGLYSALHYGLLYLKESMKEDFNCNDNTFEVLKKFAVDMYNPRNRNDDSSATKTTTKKKKKEEREENELNMIKEYRPPSASIDNKPVIVQLKITDENPDEILAKEKERLKSEQEKKEREQRELEEEKMKNIVTKEQMEIMKIKDMAIDCLAHTNRIFDALYYFELPRFRNNNNNGKSEEEKEEEIEKEKRREKEGYYEIIGPPVGDKKQGDNIIPSHAAYVGAYCTTLFLEKYLRLAEKFDDNHLRNLRVQSEQIVSDIIQGKWKDFI